MKIEIFKKSNSCYVYHEIVEKIKRVPTYKGIMLNINRKSIDFSQRVKRKNGKCFMSLIKTLSMKEK